MVDDFWNTVWANETLKYCILILRGGGMNAMANTRLAVVLDLKRQLDEAGFWWQSRTLNYWIHRFQRGDFTPPEEATT